MLKRTELLGHQMARGYRRAAVLERKVEKKTTDKLTIASLEAGMKARQLARLFKA